MEQKDIGLYKKLVLLARKQLASIEERLSKSNAGWWNEFIFKFRHVRVKNILINILNRRESKVGSSAILELITDLKGIETDEGYWKDAAKKETDYIRFILHGIKSAPEDNKDEEQQDEK